MINKTFFYFNKEDNIPYSTLALEEAMLYELNKNEIILYLYCHLPSVIIGKNQNAWKECRFETLEKDGGYLARRISGGGAVYHDVNNLNFSFIVNKEDYDVARQLKVIADAVRTFGIEAEVSGRNDILVDGKKFSGNAFCFKKDKAFHHGTILINTDPEKMSEYLSVSPDKIKSKGIDSVKSRVCNLITYNNTITVSSMADALHNAFNSEYGKSEFYTPSETTIENKKIIEQRNMTWEWKFGYEGNFDITLRKRFRWGDAEICMNLKDAVINETAVYSDAMDADFIERIKDKLKGIRFESDAVKNSLNVLPENDEQSLIVKDITSLIFDEQ